MAVGDRWFRNMFLGLLVVLVMFSTLGCARQDGNQEKTRTQKKPALRKEPQISLYVVDTQETKHLPVEEYIEGVVAGEMESGWPEEAYAAQAILARSFVMNWLEAGKQSRYGTDLSTDVEEAQAYDPDAVDDAIRRAVKKTRGQVMTYDGEYVKGWFHSYSGGKTATVVEGLDYQGENPPYARSVELPDNKYVPEGLKHWEVRFTLREVEQALEKLGVSVGTVESIRISAKGPSGRATRLVFMGSNGKQEVSAPQFRIAIGPVQMRSTLLEEMRIEDGYLVVKGTGFGHGVGLSQWDAYMLAKEGASAEEIVRRFFQGVEITRVW